MKAKLYLETTIPSYLVGRPSRDLLVAAHQEITRDWWESRRSAFELYVSELVVQTATRKRRAYHRAGRGTFERRHGLSFARIVTQLNRQWQARYA
jgi:hypothetical protein